MRAELYYSVNLDIDFSIYITHSDVDHRVKRITLYDRVNRVTVRANRKGHRSNRWWPSLSFTENTRSRYNSENVSFFDTFYTDDPNEVVKKLVEVLEDHLNTVKRLKAFAEQIKIEDYIRPAP